LIISRGLFFYLLPQLKKELGERQQFKYIKIQNLHQIIVDNFKFSQLFDTLLKFNIIISNFKNKKNAFELIKSVSEFNN
tara:strand:+ start:3843 stop:4079 length:237 start_codon:yes stop_codon:yes gene_type:complete